LRPIPDAKNLGYPWYNMAKMAPGVPFHLSIPVEGAWPKRLAKTFAWLRTNPDESGDPVVN